MRRIIVAILFISVSVGDSEAYAQTSDSSGRWQMGFTAQPFGLGWPTPSGGTLVATRVGLSVGKNNHWFTLAGDFCGILQLDLSWGAPHVPNDQYWDIGIMYGRRFRESEAGYLYAGAGVASAQTQFTTDEPAYNGSI